MLTPENLKNIRSAAALLGNCRRVFIVTGAGISADSGLPTYRGIGGLYENQSTDEGIPIESAISGEMLEARPEITWKYLSQMEEAIRGATHNRAHEIIAEMQDEFEAVWVLTQNIDGFHKDAGSRNVIDIHGDMHVLECMECEWRETVRDYTALAKKPPRCPKCNSIIRPDVVLFGEQLQPDKCAVIMREWKTGFDIVFTIGTTSVFPYISQPVSYAKHHGIPTIEINPGTTTVSGMVDIRITAKAAEAMEELWKVYCESK